MTITVPCYTQPADGDRIPAPVQICNVVATLRGSATPARHYVVSGHYDSRCSDPNDSVCDAPGADDDASGVALALELARVMVRRRPRSTMVFAAVAGEEQGLYGAKFMAQSYRNASVDVAAMFTNDIIGTPCGDGACYPDTIRLFCQGVPGTETNATQRERLVVGGENDSPARELGRYVVENAQNEYTGMNRVSMIYRVDRYLRGGDHRSFLEAGFAAARFTEPREDYKHQHQNVRVDGNGTQYGDLIEYVDFDFVAKVARVNLAALYAMSEAPAAPKNVSVDAAALSNLSKFSWVSPSEEGLAGYEIVYRPTDGPFWSHAIPVEGGDVQEATIDVSKDNVAFGVRAVGKNGYKSPAVFGGFPASY